MLCWAVLTSQCSAGDAITVGFERLKAEGFGVGASLGWRERGDSAELLAMSLCSSQAAGALAFGCFWGARVGSLVSNKGCAHLAALAVCRECACALLSLQGTGSANF